MYFNGLLFTFQNLFFNFFLDEKVTKNKGYKSNSILPFIIPKCGRVSFKQVFSLSVLLRSNFAQAQILLKADPLRKQYGILN
ncbi:MAG: hypothetical protein ACI9O4_001197 [Chitinophagales bacterium]|jgi:hypothetical protein